jgi:DNA modification methylase
MPAVPPTEKQSTTHIGHVLDVMRTLPDRSAQCVATSPPYFGLRDYGLDPVIWEPVVYAPMPGLPPTPFPAHATPEAFATCAHDWDDWHEMPDVREDAVHGKTRTTDRFYGDATRRFDGNHQKHAHGQFCCRCGAWRGCLGLEGEPNLYIGHLVQVFREARRVLAEDGVLWLNLGDSYARNGGTAAKPPTSAIIESTRSALTQIGARKQRTPGGLKPKDLVGIPWRAALALQADGWYLRSDIVWAKGASFAGSWHGNPMPESVTDRPSRAHEIVFLLTKSLRYFYDHHAVKEPAVNTAVSKATGFAPRAGDKRSAAPPHQTVGTHREGRALHDDPRPLRNLRDVWAVTTRPYPGAHFAVWPDALVRPMILSGTSEAGHCPACGKRWVRTIERTQEPNPTFKGSSFSRGKTGQRDGGDRTQPGDRYRSIAGSFAAACTCGTPPVPDVVLDMFGGSGTTAAVARSLARHAVLIDASPAYAALQTDRIDKAVAKARNGSPSMRLPLTDGKDVWRRAARTKA